jgi:hypothetical protein
MTRNVKNDNQVGSRSCRLIDIEIAKISGETVRAQELVSRVNVGHVIKGTWDNRNELQGEQPSNKNLPKGK